MLNFPNLNPNSIDSDRVKPRIRVTQLGDGYVQREADGLNTIQHFFTVAFVGLSEVNKDLLINFVQARAGIEPFLWYHPGEKRHYQMVCSEWQSTFEYPAWKVGLRFEEDFNPV
ncbi:phage tail protein [Piscirickettsia litoralis]|uniref:Phage tail protein n=1 Tax=Piscirickettsia litoralis TaxID=1891921 RepID=A0ABX3A0W6_9GAMM|nr:phage tail protein [Piscirickettsia litoralis]ODN41045.1 phage tail protein [Piscirickettsia litoralis]